MGLLAGWFVGFGLSVSSTPLIQGHPPGAAPVLRDVLTGSTYDGAAAILKEGINLPTTITVARVFAFLLYLLAVFVIAGVF